MGTNITSFFRKKNNIRLSKFLYDHCNKSKRGASYIRLYRRIARLIEVFEQSVHREIYTDSFSEEVAGEYVHFLRSCKPEKCGHNAYRQSTIRNFVHKTVSAIRKAENNGYCVVLEPLRDLSILDEDSVAVYLSIHDIEKINSLSLNKEGAQIRDIFLVGCCTALRYSDYSKLSEDNFLNGNITILTKKTNTRVSIPIHYIVKEIITRNNGYAFLNYRNSSQNFNCTIKRICKKAGITDKVMIERTEGFKKVSKIYQKYELVSSHTARRSGATNMYLAGIAPFRIMLITGHKTESAFYRYIRIQKEENAKELQSHIFFRSRNVEAYNE